MFKLRKSWLERRAIQQERLLNRDFPWLWAVKKQWVLSGDGNWTVRNPADGMKEFLMKPASADFQVWVYVKMSWKPAEFPGFRVEEVKSVPGANWARLIVDQFKLEYNRPDYRDSFGLVAVAIVDQRLGRKDDIVIYRQKSPGEIGWLASHNRSGY